MKLVIQNSASTWGGNEKWTATVAQGLIARGHEVIVSCRGGSEIERELHRQGIPTVSIRPGAYLHIPRGIRFSRWLQRMRPDAVLLTSWKPMGWGALGARLAGVPRVIVRLGLMRVPRERRHSLPFRRWVDALIVNADEIRDAWVRGVPWFPTDQVHVVLNGVASSIGASAASRQSLRSEIGAGPDSVILGAAGHITHRKGFDLLLQALQRIADDRVRAVIVGSGPEEGALRQMAQRLGVSDRVCWLGRRPDVPAVLASCDVFVLTSRNEGMANVMLEAMAAGVPVVATDICGVRTALGAESDRPAAGWIVPPDEPDALTSALREVVSDLRAGGAAIAHRVDEASSRVRSRFTVERMLDQVESTLTA